MNTDIVISFMVAGGIFALGVLAGFIIGRLTCSCRKEQRAIDRYRKDVGAEDEEEVFITPDGSKSRPRQRTRTQKPCMIRHAGTAPILTKPNTRRRRDIVS